MSTFLETARLVLRDREPRDVDFLAALHTDPRMMRWIGDGSTIDPEAYAERYAESLAREREPGHERWNAFKLVERRDDGVPLGQACLLRCEIDDVPEIEIGWFLTPAAWGNGYATEAALVLRDYAFEVLDVERLCVVLFAENIRSVAVARRIGGRDAALARYRNRTVTRYVVRNPARETPASDAAVEDDVCSPKI